MEKLSMQDASFLYSETEKMMNHIASLQQYELPEGISPSQFVTRLQTYLADRIHLLPYLTRKVQMMPGGIDHAVWVQDGNFDIKNHVVEVPLGGDASFDQVQDKVAELHSKPMDRSLPLWRFHIITGLADGTVAYYAQIHHACVDGMAGQAMTFCLTDTTPEPVAYHCPEDYIKNEAPSMTDMLRSSFENLLHYQTAAMDRSLSMMRSATSLGQRAIDPGKTFGAFGQTAPRTAFNKTIGKERTYACTRLPFMDVRKIGKTMGASINDVFLTICSGALRRYLERHGDLPKQNLLAGCPVAVARQGSADQGNSVSLMNVDLFTSVDDPRIRLLRVKDSAETAKQVTSELADSMDNNVSLFGLPALTRATTLFGELTGAANAMPMPFNVLISNVPGPRETLYSNGAKMLSHYPVSIPAHGLGLNITVQSYTDGLYVGLTASEDTVPDIKVLRDDLVAAFQELKGLVIPATVSEISRRAADLPGQPAPALDSQVA
jgi:WS/DGAT/MGAT family acyltransferase